MRNVLKIRPAILFLVLLAPAIPTIFLPLESTTVEVILALAIIEILFILIWLHVLGTAYTQRSAEAIRLRLTLFRINSILPIPVLSLFMLLPREILQQFSLILVIATLYSWFAIFYCLFFVSRAIATFEQNRTARVSEYVQYFFLLWFFPVGLWFIQPKANKLIGVGGLTGR